MGSSAPPPASLPMLRLAIDDIETISRTYLEGFPEDRRRAIVAEAERKRARLSSIPWYAEKARKRGAAYWLSLSISYMGED